MADFCKPCAKEHFGEEVDNDFKGLVEPGEYAKVLCECCGWTIVDHEGDRAFKNTKLDHKCFEGP